MNYTRYGYRRYVKEGKNSIKDKHFYMKKIDNKKQKLLEIKTNKLVDSLFVWNFKTNFKWNWIEFIDFREYNYWDDIKNIDWLVSEREWRTYIRLYEEERELSVYFIIDSDENFDFKYPSKETLLQYDNKSKYDIIEELLYLVWLSTIKWCDRLGLFIYNSDKKDFIYAKKWKLNLLNIINKSKEYIFSKRSKHIFHPKNKLFSFFRKKWELLKKYKKDNTLETFNSLKIKKSLVFLLTTKTDIDDTNLKVLALKNDLIVCNIFHSFENTLYWEWIKWFNNIDKSLHIDISNDSKRQEYIKFRKEKIKNFKRKILKLWWKYLYIDEKSNIYKDLFKLMKSKN